ncbi:flagellar basal body rod protein FlgB [Oricola thermophila]|uniref:Flagellar basal body rod protein FlgB n=1 Tax=Oricola thermophila TaxID=2742145 RepID=A0A6N1VL19_9HYPH|nr:flagellar basal body rod protein FlgB [Oricola thermophila]QKV19647.1 flagellar basal body rod protein FlgB [Oricola thermophila]
MTAVNLFKLASTQAKWLSVRQTAVANNIANANTPGYRSVDVEPFADVLSSASVRLNSTAANHFGTSANEIAFRVLDEEPATFSNQGKRVSLEDELVKSGEIRHSFELNTSIVSAFNRMILMTAKGS